MAAAFAACDPDLTVQSTPGDGGSEGGPGPIVNPPPADDGGGSEGGSEGGDDGGDASKSGHQVDGVNDFASGDKLTTTSSGTGYNAYISWDAKNVYFGMEGADISQGASSADKKWVFLYLGATGTPGSTTGIGYDCGGGCTAQQAMLPFSAAWHVRYKIDGSYANVQKWNSGSSKWEDAGIAITLTTARAGSFLEMAISRTQLGSPSKLDVHFNMLIEDTSPPGPGWTYAGSPSTSFTDGWNPTYTHYFEFDLSDTSKAPSTYAPK
jgi:hypothetical protein